MQSNCRGPLAAAFLLAQRLPAKRISRLGMSRATSRGMKLRIYGPSLRFRFDAREVEKLGQGETLTASVAFGPDAPFALCYRVVPVEDEGGLRVRFESPATITVTASLDSLRAWSQSEDLAITMEEAWEGGSLKLILEKDMQRLNPKPEEESPHAFPNPLFGKVHCTHS